MKPNCIFVNVGRGGMVDQNALVKALENKQIRVSKRYVSDTFLLLLEIIFL